MERPLGFVITVSSRVLISSLIFTIVFCAFSLLIAFVCFKNFRSFHHCFFRLLLLHHHSLPLFFTSFLYRDFFFFFDRYFIFVLRYQECYGFERACFTFRCFLRFFRRVFTPYICHRTASAMDLRELFYLQDIFTLRFFPTFGITCFYQGFTRSQPFFFDDRRAYHWVSKLRPGPSVCLNYTEFSKRYSLIGSVYMLRPYGTLYQPLPGFEPTI